MAIKSLWMESVGEANTGLSPCEALFGSRVKRRTLSMYLRKSHNYYCLAQGNFDMQTAGAWDQITFLLEGNMPQLLQMQLKVEFRAATL